MSFRNWLHNVAIGGWLALAAVLAHAQPISDNPGSQPGAAQSDTKPQNQVDPRISGAIDGLAERITRALEANKPEPKSADEEDRAKRDLAAQEGMAYWAKMMFWAAGVTVVLTGFGVLLITGTLIYTKRAAIAARDAVTEAERATKAAMTAVEVTRETARRQLRAYLNLASANLAKGMVRLKFINQGATPASSVEGVLITTFAPGAIAELPEGYVFKVDPAARRQGVSTIGGGGGERTLRFELNQQRMESVMSGEATMFALLTLTYRDVFGDRWEIVECLKFIPGLDGKPTFVHYGDYSRAT